MLPKTDNRPPDRSVWRAHREELERGPRKRYSQEKPKLKLRWFPFLLALQVFGFLLRLAGLYRRGFKNALRPQVVHHTVHFAELPQSFDGYKIVHLTDLHLDRLPNLSTILAEELKKLNVDLAAMTGDFRDRGRTTAEAIVPDVKKIVEAIDAPDGIYATFGNHDCASMVEPFEEIGTRVLTNETVTIRRGNDSILVTGIDDVHYFYSEAADEALQTPQGGFKLALVHSPEANAQAADNAYSLYLCGHTHGGQICLPGGRPIFKHIRVGHEFSKGFWSLKNMTGYTSSGAGVVGLPVRFNCPGEITVFTLRRQPSGR